MTSAGQGWVWLAANVLRAVHDEQLAEHGGASGEREGGRFDAALARPPQMAANGQPDAADLAAAYGCGIARGQPFRHGNERTALVAVELFLALNGLRLTADDAASVITWLDVAAGELDESDFAAWLRVNIDHRAA